MLGEGGSVVNRQAGVWPYDACSAIAVTCRSTDGRMRSVAWRDGTINTCKRYQRSIFQSLASDVHYGEVTNTYNSATIVTASRPRY